MLATQGVDDHEQDVIADHEAGSVAGVGAVAYHTEQVQCRMHCAGR
jgi:hypothetical protein